MRYYLIAGEASGDLHASNLMRAIQTYDKDAEFRYYGGDRMESVGGTLVQHYKEMSYMGFVPVALHARTILKNMRRCKHDILSYHPNVVILVDYPGFNLSIAKYVKKHSDIPVFYYISPKIWAWKEHRIKSIRRYVDELFSILPFEVPFYEEKHHYPIHYVGNPCMDAIEEYKQGRKRNDGTPRQRTIAIVAGSRKQELKKNLGKMLEAASTFKDYTPVITGAPGLTEEDYTPYIPKGMEVEVRFGCTYEVIEQSVAALVTSGTATLETALLGTPQVVCYFISMGKIVNRLRSWLLKVPYISLVNLICGKEVVKELVANEMTVDRVKEELGKVMPGGEKRDAVLIGYAEMRNILGEAGASERTGKLIVDFLISSRYTQK